MTLAVRGTIARARGSREGEPCLVRGCCPCSACGDGEGLRFARGRKVKRSGIDGDPAIRNGSEVFPYVCGLISRPLAGRYSQRYARESNVFKDIRVDSKRRIPRYGYIRQRRATPKGIVFDGSNGTRDFDAFQGRAIKKGILSDGGKSLGQRDTLQCATAKSIASDFLYSRGYGKVGARFLYWVADQLGLRFVVKHTVGRGEMGATGCHPDGR